RCANQSLHCSEFLASSGSSFSRTGDGGIVEMMGMRHRMTPMSHPHHLHYPPISITSVTAPSQISLGGLLLAPQRQRAPTGAGLGDIPYQTTHFTHRSPTRNLAT